MRRWSWIALVATGCLEPTPDYTDATGSGGTLSGGPTNDGDSDTGGDSDAGGDSTTTEAGSGSAGSGTTTGPATTSAGSGDSSTGPGVTGTGGGSGGSGTTDPGTTSEGTTLTPGSAGTSDGATTSSDLTTTATTGGLDRVTQDIVVLYEFEETSGTTVHDTSGVAPALDLEIADPAAVTWQPTGLLFTGDTIVESAGPATKVLDECQSTDEITIETWVTLEVAAVDPHARIVTMSLDTLNRNFTLAHYDWDLPSMPAYSGAAHFVRLRTDTTNAQGYPQFVAANSATTELTHVVHTWKSDGTEAMYIDGALWPDNIQVDNGRDIVSAPKLGTFASWDPGYKLALANEMTLDRPFHGELHLVAVYKRALSAAEVTQNFSAGF